MSETGDPELAVDLAAEVFAAVLLAARRYRAEHASAVPRLVGVARNVLGASRRRGRVEDRARRRLGLPAIALDDADLERVRALADSRHSRITELLEQLPEDERSAVSARIVQERSYSEIAVALGCSQMVARKRVSRGLARMRTQIGGAGVTDYFSELENQLGRVTGRGIHKPRRLRGRPAGVKALAAIASVLLVSAVAVLVSAVVLQTGSNHRARPSTYARPPAASVSQRSGGVSCVNSTTHTPTPCPPREAMSAASQAQFPVLTPPQAYWWATHALNGGAVVAELYLHAPSGAKRPTATARVIKHDGILGITIEGAGLRPNTKRDVYAIWLTSGPGEPVRLGFVDPGVKTNGRLIAIGPFPRDAFRYHELVIAIANLPPGGVTGLNPRVPGLVAVEGSFRR